MKLSSSIVAHAVLFVILAGSACFRVAALEVTLRELNDTTLSVSLAQVETARDKELVEKFHKSGFLQAIESGDPERFVLTLDSTPGIAQYLRAARLGGGIYVHLSQLCPERKCEGIEFVVHAKLIVFGAETAANVMRFGPVTFEQSAVFFTNESEPRFSDSLYVGPEFSTFAERQLRKSFVAIRREYQALAGSDLLAEHSIIVSMATDREGAAGFGGDFLNLIRLTFHNRRDETEQHIVRLMTLAFAHEVAHTLHRQVLSLLPQGRIISEGSADFLGEIVLQRTGLSSKAELASRLARAYDDCQDKRGSVGLLERVTRRSADYREYYNCGLIYYFALMFASAKEDALVNEKQFAQTLISVFLGAPGADSAVVRCVLIASDCDNSVLSQLLGDGAALRAQRVWFDLKLNRFIEQIHR